jgi:hypothetical protein
MAPSNTIMQADSATLKLDNQKNGWKGVCVHHKTNRHPIHCPVRALGRRYLHIRHHTRDITTFLSAFYDTEKRFDVMDTDIRKSLKQAAIILNYPVSKNIPIDRIDTHSLRTGGANALSLSGHSDREIQKMGRWRSATFKEYVQEELAGFSQGMSKKMKTRFSFVNITGGIYSEVTNEVMRIPYDIIPALEE